MPNIDLTKYSEAQLLKEAQKYNKNISSLADITADTFAKAGERGAYLNVAVLNNMKKQIQSGQLKISDYSNMVAPFAEAVTKDLKKWSNINVDYANSARELGAELSKFADIGAKSDGGYDYTYKDFKVPFSRQEYAKLDTKVLPTKQDVETGLIARDAVPFQRFQDPQGGGVDAQGNPIPADINLGSDRGAIELEAQRQAGQLQTTLDQQKTLRDENRRKLAETLAADRTEAFNRAIPQLAEHANTQGILRSTGFGDLLSQKYTDLTRDVQSRLAEAEYGDSEKYVGGLGDVANVRAGLQTSGLQREFSLDDASRSEDLARELALLSKPSEGGGKSSGEKWAQGVTAGGTLLSGAAAAFKPK